VNQGLPVGVIYGKVHITHFQMLVYEESGLQKDEYLAVEHAEGNLLCCVVGMTRDSKMTVKEAQDFMNTTFTNEVAGNLIADVVVLGMKNTDTNYPGATIMPRTPLNAGIKVKRAKPEFIRDSLGFNRRGAYVGHLRNYRIPVNLDFNSLVQRHLAIIASTGGGKSYTTGIVIEEMMPLDIPILIFDVHGEYQTLKYPNKDARSDQLTRFNLTPEVNMNKVVEYTISGRPGTHQLRLGNKNLSVDDIIKLNSRYATRMSNNQIGLLRAATKYLTEKKGEYTLEDLIKVIELERKNVRIKEAVLQVLENIKGYGIFDMEESQTAISVPQIIRSNKVHILNLAEVEEDLLREIIVGKVLEDVFNYKKETRNTGKAMRPMVLVMDECHNFIPEGRTIHTSEIIYKIAKEGRKMGLGWVFISQRPQDINKKVLSQCQTQIIMNLKNDKDIAAVSNAFESVDKFVSSEFPHLQPGRGVVCGAGLTRPLLVDFRVRKTMPGGMSADFTGLMKNGF
jgi:DNA helicase HerA-like ATPase